MSPNDPIGVAPMTLQGVIAIIVSALGVAVAAILGHRAGQVKGLEAGLTKAYQDMEAARQRVRANIAVTEAKAEIDAALKKQRNASEQEKLEATPDTEIKELDFTELIRRSKP